MKTFNTVDELEAFILKHGENIVDLMGGQIDRIEIKLRVSVVFIDLLARLPSIQEWLLTLYCFPRLCSTEKVSRSAAL